MASSRYSYDRLLKILQEQSHNPLSTRVQKTLRLAYDGHRGQFRESRNRDDRIPFIVHPVGTARMAIANYEAVRNYVQIDLDTLICIALTHDLLEDTQVDIAILEEVAGADARLVVEALTKPPAGVIGKSGDDRNKEFLDQIANAGPAAVYIKLCDSMHNLSHPETTPTALYRKVVAKARGLYLTLLDRCSLGPKFANTFRSCLNESEDRIVLKDSSTGSKLLPLGLADAVRDCVAASTGKVLELHDISEILNRISGARSASIWRITGKNADELNAVSVAGEDVIVQRSFRARVGDAPAIVQGPGLVEYPISQKTKDTALLYLIPIQVGPGGSFVVVLLFDEAVPPEWLTVDAAALMSQFLAHRLIVSEAERRTRIATEAARLGMQVDADLATESGIKPPDLVRLDRWRTRCKQATKVVEYLLDLHILSDASPRGSLHSIRVDSRVKTVNSILRKFMRRRNKTVCEFEDMEDIAGVRVTCPIPAGIEEIKNLLEGPKAHKAGCRLHSTIPRPVRDFVSTPTSDGYRAVHLILEVETDLKDEGIRMIPCEIQLRTVFQDIWANIAHDTFYATTGKKRPLEKQLRTMGEELQRCEQLADDIARRTR